jgi:hypothetical protein
LENIKNEIAYFEGVVGLLDETCVARLDFDELRSHLRAVCAMLNSVEAQAVDHTLLREDIEQRIGGMIKAIAAVDRKRERWEEAAALVDELVTMTPKRLLETHRHVAARFRDCFPGSFGPRNFGGRKIQPSAR